MGLFSGRGKSGGLMNVIRCDQQDYLVWKWRPLDQDVNSTTRENSIRLGSSLRVKDGEMAVFVYRQNNGTMQDYIYGPYDGFLKTANFPVLANIMGAAYGGEAPFQAEVYFINLSGNIQIPFGIPFFDVPDPRFLDFVVPIAAGGKITFNITDPQRFIKMNRLVNFDLDDFSEQVRSTVVRRVKSVIANAPAEGGFPLVQIERKIDEINDAIAAKLKGDFEEFGFRPVQTSLGRLGVLVCWDQWYPEAARVMALSGAEMLVYPTAIGWNPDDTQDEKERQCEAWITIQRSHAVANGIPVISVNRVGFEDDPSGVTSGIDFWGSSFVAGPQGEILYMAPSTQSAEQVVELDMVRTENVRRWWPFLRDRRIDAYSPLMKRYIDPEV